MIIVQLDMKLNWSYTQAQVLLTCLLTCPNAKVNLSRQVESTDHKNKEVNRTQIFFNKKLFFFIDLTTITFDHQMTECHIPYTRKIYLSKKQPSLENKPHNIIECRQTSKKYQQLKNVNIIQTADISCANTVHNNIRIQVSANLTTNISH